VAEVELGWLDGSLGSLSRSARRALDLAARSDRSVQVALCAHLRLAGVVGRGRGPSPELACSVAVCWPQSVL
jgi:hypothetical protein